MNNKKLDLRDYIFGYIDAEKELTFKPSIIEKAFYDPYNYIEKLLNDIEFMLIGRKGVGKTTYSAKLRQISSESNEIHAEQISLSKFNFDDFYKTKNDNYDGSRKFKTAWDLIFLIEIFSFIENSGGFSTIESYERCITSLKQNGLIFDKDSFNSIVTELASNEIEFNFKAVKSTSILNHKKIVLSQNQIVEYLISVLKEIYFNGSKFMIIIDGLDDILRFKKEQTEILSGLIRSLDDLNNIFAQNKVGVKIILLIRDDILASINDPDFTKIKNDCGIYINWNNIDDLKELINLRFKLSGITNRSSSHWYNIFPNKINDLDSWKFIVDRTLMKPRDLIQFMILCQRDFPNAERLTLGMVNSLLESYSREYFLSEMKSTLSGFIDDDIVNCVDIAFKSIGQTDFTITKFFGKLKSKCPDIKKSSAEKIIEILFSNGYVGQLVTKTSIKSGKESYKNYIDFKYRNHILSFDPEAKFRVHHGLYYALGFYKK